MSTGPHPESFPMVAADMRAEGAATREEGPRQHEGPASLLPPT